MGSHRCGNLEGEHCKGYYLLRATVPIDTLGLATYAYDTLANMILPLPSAQWEKLVDEDTYYCSSLTSIWKKPASSETWYNKLNNRTTFSIRLILWLCWQPINPKSCQCHGFTIYRQNRATGKQYIYKVGIHGLKMTTPQHMQIRKQFSILQVPFHLCLSVKKIHYYQMGPFWWINGVILPTM